MNILLICDEYPPGRHGGIGTAVQLQAHAMRALGHKVVVAGFYDWGYGGEDQYDDDGITVYRFRRKLDYRIFRPPAGLYRRALYFLASKTGLLRADIRRSLVKYQAFLQKVIARHDIDILEVPDYQDYLRFAPHPAIYAWLGVPYIVKLHGSHSYFAGENGSAVSTAVKLAELALLNGAKGVIAVSKYVGEQTQRYLPFTGRVEVIYNGIELPPPAAGAFESRRDIVFTGSLLQKKGIYQLMKAWNVAGPQLPGVHLHIYGRGRTDQASALLDDTARRSVTFHGAVSRAAVMELLKAARVAVFPSYAEAFSLAPMEAMACGAAVIYTVLTSGPELITNGIDGILIHPDDVDALAQSMVMLMSDPTRAENLAAAGNTRIREHFELSRLAAQHIRLYTALLQSAHEPS